MSVFRDEQIPCPHCGQIEQRNIAVSVCGSRSRERRQAILTDQLHRFTCSACGVPYIVERPFTYIDLDRGHWIGVYPTAWERSWRDLEQTPHQLFQESVVKNAPPMIQSLAPSIQVRTVFGLVALRDKLCCMSAGIDDRKLEALKLELLRSHPSFALHPAARPALWSADDQYLDFSLAVPSSGQHPPAASLRLDRSLLDTVSGTGWAAALRLFGEGPYVDVGRVLFAGTDRRAASLRSELHRAVR